jgi:ABC-type dipeptide/oligopeptide/nickel transport system permease subunit
MWMPGIALMLVALCGNLVGDWLRDLLDPRLRNLG